MGKKKICFFILILIMQSAICINTSAMTIRADVSPYYPENDSVPAGDFYIEILMNNNDGFVRTVSATPFALYSPDGSITNVTHRDVGGYGPAGSILALNGYQDNGFWDMFNGVTATSWEGVLPDTMAHAGLSLAAGFPSGLGEQVYLRIALRVEEEGLLCIDSTEYPANHNYDWYFQEPVPSFGGPYCWNIVIQSDFDGDGIINIDDNCPHIYNPGQENSDGDSMGDVCDNCPDVSNENQQNSDTDSFGDACDNCPDVSNESQTNSDGDSHGDICDNCPDVDNENQRDADQDGIGDACDILTPDFEGEPKYGMAPLEVAFTDLTVSLEPIDSWLWGFGDNTTDNVQHPIHIYDDTGFYDVSLIVSAAGVVDTIVKTGYINVFDSVNVPFYISTALFAEVVSIKSVDLDRDNIADLVFSSMFISKCYVAFGLGDGEFDSPYEILSGSGSMAFDFAFIDGDTLMDIIIADNSNIHSLINNGDRTFSVSSISYIGATVSDLSLGYLNNDTYIDAVVTGGDIYFGDGSGGFVFSESLPLTIQSVDLGDFNNDDYDDIVVSSPDGSAYIYLNNGFGSFSEASSLPVGGTSFSVTTANAMADFNLDGNSDFAMIVPHIGPQHESMIYIIYGDGSGGMNPANIDTIRVFGVAYNLVAVDVNRDTRLDVVCANGSDKTVEIYYGNELGHFVDTFIVNIPTDDITYALASGDFDRDGNTDFITAGPFSGPSDVFLLINLLPDAPVIDDEMKTTGYSSVSVSVINPGSFSISRNYNTVAGSDYWRLDADDDNFLDEEAIDYNLQYGEYMIVIEPRPGIGNDEPFSIGIQINGSALSVPFLDYSAFVNVKNPGNSEPDSSIVFYYTVEPTSSIQPPNGVPTGDNTPTFDWSGRVADIPSVDSFHFQLDAYHDFRSDPLIVNISGLTEPTYTMTSPLGPDSVYYWRFRQYQDGDWTDYSRTFAAYIVAFMCGDVNQDNTVNLLDITYLISYLYKSGPAPEPLDAADVNSDGTANILDITYLISFLYKDGQEPDCP